MDAILSSTVQYRFVLGTSKEHDLVLAFLQKHFRHEEPICRSMDLQEVDAASFFPDIVRTSLREPVSILTYLDDELVGVRLSCIARRKDQEHKADDGAQSSPPPTAKAWLIMHFLDLVEANLWDLLPADMNEVLMFQVVSVHPNHYRKGIAKRSSEKSMAVASKMGLSACVTIATAHNSQQLFNKINFQLLKELSHCDYKDKNGCPIFKCDDATNKAALMYFRL